MSVNDYRKCAKCGKSRSQDMRVTYHRFPNPGKNNISKARAWAKYCWPNEDWTAVESLVSLHITNKVLCGRHFKISQFYDNQRQKLSKFALPDFDEASTEIINKENLLTKMPPRRQISQRQLEMLVEFAENHQDISLGRSSGVRLLSHESARQAWESIAVQLNSDTEGVYKTSEQWRRYWIEFKAKTKMKAADSRRMSSAGLPNKLSPLTDIEQQVVALIGSMEGGHGVPDTFNDENVSQESHVQASIAFTKVKRGLIELVKEHNMPVFIVDLQPFRDILNLIPMSSEERTSLSADSVEKLVEEMKDDNYDKDDSSETIEELYLLEAEDISTQRPCTVKADYSECTCSKDDDDHNHEDFCPAKMNCFNYFDVSVDTAICNFCNETVNWNSTSDLKSHLKNRHPDIEFLNEEQLKQSATSQEVTLLEDNEDIPPERKRKKLEHKTTGAQKEMTRAIIKISSTQKDNATVKNCESKSKILAQIFEDESLEKFGQYVTSLLKHIPKKKSEKLQMQIIQRLLQEKGVAG